MIVTPGQSGGRTPDPAGHDLGRRRPALPHDVARPPQYRSPPVALERVELLGTPYRSDDLSGRRIADGTEAHGRAAAEIDFSRLESTLWVTGGRYGHPFAGDGSDARQRMYDAVCGSAS